MTTIFQNLKLTKTDYLTLLFFFIGYIFCLNDKVISNSFAMIAKELSSGFFALTYIILFFLIFLSLKIIVKEAKNYKENKSKYFPIKAIFIGYFLGLLTSISNEFILELFSRF